MNFLSGLSPFLCRPSVTLFTRQNEYRSPGAQYFLPIARSSWAEPSRRDQCLLTAKRQTQTSIVSGVQNLVARSS